MSAFNKQQPCNKQKGNVAVFIVLRLPGSLFGYEANAVKTKKKSQLQTEETDMMLVLSVDKARLTSKNRVTENMLSSCVAAKTFLWKAI